MDRKERIRQRWALINKLFIILIVVIVAFTIAREVHIFMYTNTHYEERLIEYRKSELELEISARIDEINSIEMQVESEFKEELKYQIYMMDHFASQNVSTMVGTPTLNEKRELYIDSIYEYDLAEDEYLFFSFDTAGEAWLMGLDKSAEHSSIIGLIDPVTGERFVEDMINVVLDSETNDGFHTYNWPKVLGGDPIEKTSYLYYNEEVDLIIGTGMYLDDYKENVQQELITRIDAYYNDTEEYVYILGFDATIFAHPSPDFTSEFLLSLELTNGAPAHEYIVAELEDKESLWVSYVGPNSDLELVQKTGYIHEIDGWDMYMGKAIFLDDIELITQSYMRDSLFSLVVTVIMMTLIAGALIYYLKRLINHNFNDVQDEFNEQNEKIAAFSLRDSLTGLYNRKYFNRAFMNYHKNDLSQYSLIQGDANGLKLTNDAFGHHEGDKLLQKISLYLEEVFEGDDIFRWGGDEFLILSKVTEKEEIKNKLKRFQEESNAESNTKVSISVSFGYVICDKKTDPYEEMKKAEKMMYDRKTLESTSTKRKIIDSILESLYGSFNFEREHSHNVMTNALLVGTSLGMHKVELSKLRLGALMHDIGKIGIPDGIVNKPGKLTNEEFAEVKKHPEKGYRILSAYPELSEYGYIVLHHHERFDGTGYPRKLKGEEIPLHSRIITVVDAYDAMIEERVYKERMTSEAALKELIRCKGTQFDPDIVDAFVKIKNKS